MAQTYTSLITDVDAGVDSVNRDRRDTADINAPTTSHALATADHEEKGAVQLEGRTNYDTTNINGAAADGGGQVIGYGEAVAPIADLGWHDPPEAIPDPLVGGVSNEDLWTLMRRFDKQIQHVRVTHNYVKGDLDLNVSPDEAFSPDRLRGNVERLYTTVIIGVMTFAKHIARIRSWEDKRRTAAFCFTYFLAWALDILMPLGISMLILLIVYPPARRIFFPPLPLATTDAKSGTAKPPPSGSLASHSMTGAPESQPGEAVEQEAHNFVSGFGAIAISSAAGKPHNDFDESGKGAPDPTDAAIKAADVKDDIEGADSVAKKATKKPVEEAMWENARPFMQIVGETADMWERFANALSPTAPFSQRAKYQLASPLVPLFAASFLITPYMLVKATTFTIGVAFYSQPYISTGLVWLNKNYPNWKEAISLQNTLLKSVPTNAQLTLTLLRIGEANNAPLPPPTTSLQKHRQAEAHHEQNESKADADKPLYHPDHPEHPAHPNQKSKSKTPQKALAALKQTVKAGVQTVLHADHAKAKIAQSQAAKNRLGAVAEPEKVSSAPQGPKLFAARWQGIKGHVVVLKSEALGPVLKWTAEDGKEEWCVPVEDIVEVEKLGGFGWKGKMVVGWSLEKKVVDAVRIVYRVPVREEGTGMCVGEKLREEKLLTAVVGRDELVNRLVAIGGQRWECC